MSHTHASMLVASKISVPSEAGDTDDPMDVPSVVYQTRLLLPSSSA